jgi:hypothetical protein
VKALGRTHWAVADGYLPGWSIGPEPELESHGTVSILNAGDGDASISVTILFQDRDPAGPFHLTVPAHRVLHQRLTELDDPEPIPRATDFGVVIESTVPVVVQHTRLDSRQDENALMTTIAFGD